MINKNDLLKLVDDEIDIEKREMPFARVEGASSVFATQLKIDTIERIKKIIETLDTQTPQVLIESKIVEVSERYTKEIGLRKGLQFGYDPITATSGLNAPANQGAFSFSSAPSPTSNIFGLILGNHLWPTLTQTLN